ncbi:site-specific DNA-methyltransferase [Bacillus sp. WC2503]|uniref:site-specific DNA-methyltransferase n=1 Tax=Bacillus sp. WC2503 TaxID=3461402 RepID=UPI004043F5F9
MSNEQEPQNVEEYIFDEPIKGFPTLNWKGKRAYTSTQYYPAQLKESYGEPQNGWMNKIFWGDNLQVMSHLLKKYRGQFKLIYIDPPFDSKAQYKKSVSIKGKSAENDTSFFEDTQYNDIWANDDYLQFMYERLILLRELLADDGSIYLHCDWHKSHHLRMIMDEIFGESNFRNEIIWVRSTNPKGSQHESRTFSHFTDTIFYYVKTPSAELNLNAVRIPLTEKEIEEKYSRKDETGRYYDAPILRSNGMGERPHLVYEYKGFTPGPAGWRMKKSSLEKLDLEGNLGWSKTGKPFRKLRPESDKGKPVGSFWNDISLINSQAEERVGYPTQKPVKLLERIILASSKPGDIVFDCFMGSGTTQNAAMNLGRKFIGADINLGSIQTTTKRLINEVRKIDALLKADSGQMTFKTEFEDEVTSDSISEYYTGFNVYNVNNYDVFKNPVEAKNILLEVLEVQPLISNSVFDGEKDGAMVKIMPVNRITTKADLNDLITNIDYKMYEKRQQENPMQIVENIILVCMGHDSEIGPYLQKEIPFKVKVEVIDILRDRSKLEFKRDSEATVSIQNGKLLIDSFYPMNLLQKLSIMQENVSNWKELVESVMIDWNYDGAVLEPTILDIPAKNEFVEGVYEIPEDAGTIRVKITDLLSESLEVSIENE